MHDLRIIFKTTKYRGSVLKNNIFISPINDNGKYDKLYFLMPSDFNKLSGRIIINNNNFQYNSYFYNKI